MPAHSTRTTSKIPVELFRIIAECLAHPVPAASTLSRLCRVSKAFQPEAERVLYRHVRCLSPESVVLFCRTVMDKERLSDKVEALHITTTARHRGAAVLDTICSALQHFQSLRELVWDDQEFHHLDYSLNLPGPLHVLAGCANLDLRKLTCNFLVDRRIFPFLEKQPNLVDLRCRSFYVWHVVEDISLADGFLADLIVLHAPASFMTLLGSSTLNIAHLDLNANLDMDIEEPETLNMLGSLSPKLDTLRLYGQWASSMLQVMEIIAERIPNLKVWAFQGQEPTKPDVSQLWGIVTKFKALETMVIPPFTWSQAFCMHVTDGLVNACPTLNQVAFYDTSRASWCFVRSTPEDRMQIEEEDEFKLDPSVFDTPIVA